MAGSKPVMNFRCKGITVALWNNGTSYGLSISKWFKMKNGQSKTGTSYFVDDGPIISKLVDMAFGWALTHPLSKPGTENASAPAVETQTVDLAAEMDTTDMDQLF